MTLRDRLNNEPFLPGLLEYLVQQNWATEADLQAELDRILAAYRRCPATGIGSLTHRERKFLNTFG